MWIFVSDFFIYSSQCIFRPKEENNFFTSSYKLFFINSKYFPYELFEYSRIIITYAIFLKEKVTQEIN